MPTTVVHAYKGHQQIVSRLSVVARISADHEAFCQVNCAITGRLVDGAQEVLGSQGHGSPSAQTPPARSRGTLEVAPGGGVPACVERRGQGRLNDKHDLAMLARKVDHRRHALTEPLG
jgi:hypothetical protein